MTIKDAMNIRAPTIITKLAVSVRRWLESRLEPPRYQQRTRSLAIPEPLVIASSTVRES